MKPGKISEVNSLTTKAGKPYKRIVIDGEKYSVFDAKLFDYCGEGRNIMFSFAEKDGFKNIVAMAEVLGGAPSPAQSKPSKTTETDNYRRCNANNNGTTMMDIFQREGLLAGKNPQEIMQIKQSLLKL